MKTKKSKCPICQTRPAIIDHAYGVLPCEKCSNLMDHEMDKVGSFKLEFTSPSIKNQRKEYQRSMLQPFVGGVLSKEFIEENGTSKLAGVTERDIKEAKYVYKDLPRWHKRGESKR